MFRPIKLETTYHFSFKNSFQEFYFPVDKNVHINGLLFPAQKSKGLIFYLHGNGGSIDNWGNTAEIYLNNNYDFFVLDYRGFGKSEGEISNEKQLYKDIQIVYDSLKHFYSEENIIIVGFSIGTGPAAKLAANNHPKWLILNAPYYNLRSLARQYIKFIPILFLKFKLETNVFIQQVKCPITIFHGDKDEVIHVDATLKLKKLLKKEDQVFILHGQKHNGINENGIYLNEMKKILNTNSNSLVKK